MFRPLRICALACGVALAAPAGAAAPACTAVAGSRPPLVVELYTSEGCSSCPPADRWLSTLKGRDDVLALAFHVDYWDRLGWIDRFASPAATARQYALARAWAAPNVYTPQVVADGRDWRGWPTLPPAPHGSPVTLSLQREGDEVVATVGPARDRDELAGYWAVVEDGHASRVLAGENAGQALTHDHVVRLYRPVPAWPAGLARRFSLAVLPGLRAHPRRVVFIVADPQTHRPLQALALSC
jgi:hypothetical protein